MDANKIVIRVDVETDDRDLRGNVLASGDDKVDRVAEAKVLDQLERGNVYAWAWVRVTAQCGAFTGEDSLSGVDYESRKAFEKDLLPEMKQNALNDLKQEMGPRAHAAYVEAVERLNEGARLLRRFDTLPIEEV